MSKKHLELQKTKYNASSSPTTPSYATDPNKMFRKRRRLPTPRLLGTDPIGIPHLTGLLDTYTNEQYKSVINNLPKSWQDINEKGTLVAKR